ncbi:MAG: DMT family transporter [Prolixibacteraceae bacterium]|jgi:drug/metabolite transporter (DMT)-like permease|nr:DMT family transporter [Prolixibacteraceae bacterium]
MKCPISLLNNLSLKTNNSNRSVLYALIAILFWSTVPTAFKIGLNNFQPAQLIFIASIVTVLVLSVDLLLTRKTSKLITLKLNDYVYFALLGAINPFLYYIILFKAYSLLPAQVAQPLNMVWPIVLVLLSVPLLKQKIGTRSFSALIISFVGVVLIASQGKYVTIEKSSTSGVLLALGSSILWSFYWIFSMKNKNDQLITLFVSFVFGSLYLLVYLATNQQLNIHFDHKSTAAAIYIGLFEIGITFILWLKALSLAPNSVRIANLVYIAPFLSLFFVHSILGEKIHTTTIVGIIFIVSGILLQQTEKNSKT